MSDIRFRQSLAFLQGHALFGGFTRKDLAEVIPLLEEEGFSSGVDIVTEGEVGDRLYFIEEGVVEVLKLNKDGSEVILTQLLEGDAFGEMELIDAQSRSATVRALGEVQCLSLSSRSLYQLYTGDLELYTRLLLNLARELSRRLRKMDDLVNRITDR